MNNEIEERLKQLKIEDFIWVIYIGLIILSIISNKYERNYFIYKDDKSREKYRELTIFIFIVALLVYVYYLYDSYTSYKNLNQYDSENKKKFTSYSFIASLLIFIAGIIFLCIAIKDENLETEVAFN